MKRFAEMTCEELVRKAGYDCPCGKHHACGMDYLKIGRGVIRFLPDMLKAMGRQKPFVVCDSNTWKAAGEKAVQILKDNGIPFGLYIIPGGRIAPAEWEVGSVVMRFDPACDMLLAVGSGVINDICKVVGKAVGKPSAVIGTAPSMDGYASNSSSMEVNHVKVSLYNHAPVGILLDTEILSQAPMRMLWAGLGDMIAKYIAVCEWRISHLVTGEYYCGEIAEMMRTAVKKVVSAADGIAKRDPDAIGAIAEGLIIAGVAMAYAEISRPASGLEHYFSHMWEMMALERNQPYDLHGIQVGVGTVLCMKLYETIPTIVPDRAKAEAHMRAFSPEKWEAHVRRVFGKTADEIIAIEQKTRKNSPERHQKRLDNILNHWDDILSVIREELLNEERLFSVLRSLGVPMMPKDISLTDEDAVNAFLGSRDVRDKYITSSFLWDLGLTEEYAEKLRAILRAEQA